MITLYHAANGALACLGLACLGLAAQSPAAHAADLPSQKAAPVAAPAPAPAPWGGFFIGAGASYNRMLGRDGNIYATGLSEVYQGAAIAATGAATGGTDVPLRAHNGVAPAVQAGYIGHIGGSAWLWGVKATYNYAGGKADANNVLVPQYGGFQSSDPNTSFEGRLLVHQYKASLKHQFALLPIIGYSFGQLGVYAGAGPTISQTTGEMNGVIGFANINGRHQDITGTPVNFKTSHWTVGGAATVGVLWRFDDHWFLDVNYTYARTGKTRDRFFAPFVNPDGGYTYTGVGFGTYTASTINHAVSASLNYRF